MAEEGYNMSETLKESKTNKTAQNKGSVLKRLVRHKKEEVTVISRKDGTVRIAYWNKTTGETQIICSIKIAKIIQGKLREIVYA